ncbi:DUF4276 family protein [Streptosporangiaceae bacterium NEAU-GS5]|nr:DUF4276 family protein [Streptosporangiaceae bacterium NEAU-GS5]
MRSVSCVLIREGPSDDWFLPIILRRALEVLVIERFPACREVQEIRSLPAAGNQHPDTVHQALVCERGTFDIVLYHHDGAPAAKSDPIIDRMREWAADGLGEPMVAVVPMRETEAWLLADAEALTRVLSVRKLRRPPAPGAAVETCLDPKAAVNELLKCEAGLNPAKPGVLRNFYVAVAETADIAQLRKVPAFQRWWNDMIDALEGLGYHYG